MFNPLRTASRRPPLRSLRWNSTPSLQTPPLMVTMKTDLKTAMKTKDTARLDTLRSIISEYNNLAKTPKPIQSDIQLLSLIEKRVTEAKEAVQEFARANRPDLKEKQDAQIAVLDEYASQVETMRQEEIHAIVSQQISKMKEAGENNLNIGVVMRGLSRDGDPFKGKAHMGKVAEVIKGVLSQK